MLFAWVFKIYANPIFKALFNFSARYPMLLLKLLNNFGRNNQRIHVPTVYTKPNLVKSFEPNMPLSTFPAITSKNRTLLHFRIISAFLYAVLQVGLR